LAVEGKTMVIGHILKIGNRPFKAALVAESCELSRQLVRYHLESFVSNGWVEKRGRGQYYVLNKEALIESLVDSAESTAMRLPKNTLIMPFNDYAKIVRTVVYMKVLGINNAVDLNIALTREFDDIIRGFKQLKRFLNNSQSDSTKVATKFLSNETSPEKIWAALVTALDIEIEMSQEEWIMAFKEKLNE
jgi:hypothetical protein